LYIDDNIRGVLPYSISQGIGLAYEWFNQTQCLNHISYQRFNQSSCLNYVFNFFNRFKPISFEKCSF